MRATSLVANAVLLTALAVPTSQPASAQAVSSIAAGMSVSAIVGTLRSAALDIVRELDKTVGVNSFQIRQHLLLIVSELEHAALTLEGKFFKDLDATQQAFFRNVEGTVHEASRAANQPLDKLDAVAKTLATAVERIPLADGSPRILRSTPSYVVAKANASEVRVSFDGSRLNYGPPTLKFGAAECKLAGHTDVLLDFVCPGNLFRASASVSPVSGNLVVDDVETFWAKVKNVFRHYDPKKQYRVLVQAVPEVLGTAELYTQFEETVEEFADRSAPLNASNNHCEGEREHGPFTFSVQGGPEWSIVPGSARWGGESTGNQQRSVNGPFDLTPKGFRFMAKLKNGGDCGPYRPFSSDRLWVDARAWVGGNVLWRESKPTTVRKEADQSVGVLKWGQDVAIPLPDRLTAFRLTVRQIDGGAPVIIDKDNSLRWFRVDHDTAKRTLVIRPRPIEEAMR